MYTYIHTWGRGGVELSCVTFWITNLGRETHELATSFGNATLSRKTQHPSE